MFYRRASLLLLLLSGAAAPAVADVIHLKSGDKPLEGILEDAGDVYLVHFRNGSRYVSMRDVAKVEKSDAPWVVYDSRAAGARASNSAADHWALADWCLQHDLREERLAECYAVLAIDPDHEPARTALGYVRVEGGWVPGGREPSWRRSAAARAWLADPKNEALRASLAEAIRAALAEPEAGARTARCRKIRELGQVPFGVYETLVRESPTGSASEADVGDLTLDLTLPAGRARLQYHLRVPASYDPSRRWPLLVQMHGTGMDARFERDRFARAAGEEGFFLAAPQASSKNWDKGWGSTGEERTAALLTIDDVVRRYNVDPDRVFLGGLSMGANGTWEIGSLYPDRFAGLIPEIGAPRLVNFGSLGNLRPVPMYCIVGAKDQEQMVWNNREAERFLREAGADITYNEYAQYGHQPMPGETARACVWAARRRRDPYPPAVELALTHLEHGRAWWIRVDRFTKPVWDPYTDRSVPVEKGAGKEDTLRAYIAKCRKQIAHIRAIVASPTRIDITCDQIAEITVFVSDELVDLDQPVEIWTNGKRAFTGRVERDLDRMISHAVESNDRGRVFSNWVGVKVR
ncbi:MAG: hypothetical protein HYY93_07570 [Planctomycetes bacterium]|nr:hypothetical protein [Planctomycetota bacterium]